MSEDYNQVRIDALNDAAYAVSRCHEGTVAELRIIEKAVSAIAALFPQDPAPTEPKEGGDG